MNSESSKGSGGRKSAITNHQIAAATSPHRRTSDLLGNFRDFDRLFDQLGEPVVISLGQPLPDTKFLPKKRVGSCPQAHNLALLGKRKQRPD